MWELACLRLALTGDWSVETRNLIQVQHPNPPAIGYLRASGELPVRCLAGHRRLQKPNGPSAPALTQGAGKHWRAGLRVQIG